MTPTLNFPADPCAQEITCRSAREAIEQTANVCRPQTLDRLIGLLTPEARWHLANCREVFTPAPELAEPSCYSVAAAHIDAIQSQAAFVR